MRTTCAIWVNQPPNQPPVNRARAWRLGVESCQIWPSSAQARVNFMAIQSGSQKHFFWRTYVRYYFSPKKCFYEPLWSEVKIAYSLRIGRVWKRMEVSGRESKRMEENGRTYICSYKKALLRTNLNRHKINVYLCWWWSNLATFNPQSSYPRAIYGGLI